MSAKPHVVKLRATADPSPMWRLGAVLDRLPPESRRLWEMFVVAIATAALQTERAARRKARRAAWTARPGA
jgi:hypothetical protein